MGWLAKQACAAHSACVSHFLFKAHCVTRCILDPHCSFKRVFFYGKNLPNQTDWMHCYLVWDHCPVGQLDVRMPYTMCHNAWARPRIHQDIIYHLSLVMIHYSALARAQFAVLCWRLGLSAFHYFTFPFWRGWSIIFVMEKYSLRRRLSQLMENRRSTMCCIYCKRNRALGQIEKR